MREFKRKTQANPLSLIKLTTASILFALAGPTILRAGTITHSAMTAASYNDLVYYENLCITANFWGVEIFKILEDHTLVSVSRMSTRGRAEFVDAADGLAAVSNLDGIVELFYLNGMTLSPAGSIEPGFHPVAVKFVGHYLYVGGLEVSLRVYDISDPRFPTEVNEINFGGYPHDYFVRNDTMFVAAYHGGVVLLEIEDPARPLLLQQYDLGNFVYGLALDGNYIYACVHSSGLIVLDMTSQNMPVIGYNAQFGSARKAVLTTEGLLVLDGFGGLSMVDVSSPSRPEILWHESLDFNSLDFYLVDGCLAVANWNNGFKLYSIDLKNGLEHADEIINYSVCRSVALTHGRVYAGSGTGGLMVYDRELNPDQSQGNYPGGNCLEVKTEGDYGFLSNGENGIAILDISNPSDLKLLCSYGTRGWVKSSAIAGDMLYLANWQGIVAVDIGDITNPFEANFLDTDFGSSKIEYRNDTLFVAGSGGLELYDVTNPDNIDFIIAYRTAYPAVGLEIENDLILLSSGLGGVDILTLAGGLNLISHINPLENSTATELQNGALFVAENYSGVAEWDVTEIDRPVFVRRFASTGRAVDLKFFQDKLYVADYYGVSVIETGINERYYNDYSDLSGSDRPEILSYPNPVNGGANIRFELASPGKVEVTVYDLLGRKVKTVFSGYLTAGTNTLSWDGAGIASGCYFVNVRGNGFYSSRPVTIIK